MFLLLLLLLLLLLGSGSIRNTMNLISLIIIFSSLLLIFIKVLAFTFAIIVWLVEITIESLFIIVLSLVFLNLSDQRIKQTWKWKFSLYESFVEFVLGIVDEVERPDME